MILRSALLCLALLLPALAAAQGTTAFTYQGRLYNNGALVNGSGYVLRVTAYAQENGGNTRDPRRCLRIYYFWDEESQMVVIATMPAHIRTGAT